MFLMPALYTPAEIAREIGKKAKALRLSKNLSRKTLAEQSGISESSIKRFEQTGAITLEALVLLAIPLDEVDQVAKLFQYIQPKSIEEVRNMKRKRGRA